MKKSLFLVVALSLFALLPAVAVEVPVGPGVSPETPVGEDIYYHIGPLNLHVPWNHLSAVYLYDFEAERNLVGGEVIIARLWKIDGTAGLLTNSRGIGAPYLGGTLWIPNPIRLIAVLSQIQPGVFGGYDFNRESALWGIKAALPIF